MQDFAFHAPEHITPGQFAQFVRQFVKFVQIWMQLQRPAYSLMPMPNLQLSSQSVTKCLL